MYNTRRGLLLLHEYKINQCIKFLYLDVWKWIYFDKEIPLFKPLQIRISNK